MNPLITIKQLTVSYGDTLVLEHANLTVYDDDFVGIIGPNGGGKTTLVKALLKSIPFSGEVVYHADLLHDGRPQIGYLPQVTDFDRSFPISAREVVLSGLQSDKGLWGRYRRGDHAKAVALLRRAGILSLEKRAVGGLSGGEFQRVLLCRALISEPRLLILDEPNNFVDNQFEKELYELLRDLSRQLAIVMVSHDVGTITSYIRSIVCVNRTVHRHDSNVITPEQLANYHCPIQLVCHGEVPHTVLERH